MCAESLLCFRQCLGQVVFASEEFSHPHAALLSAKFVSAEHTFIGGHLTGTVTKCTVLAHQNAPVMPQERGLG